LAQLTQPTTDIIDTTDLIDKVTAKLQADGRRRGKVPRPATLIDSHRTLAGLSRRPDVLAAEAALSGPATKPTGMEARITRLHSSVAGSSQWSGWQQMAAVAEDHLVCGVLPDGPRGTQLSRIAVLIVEGHAFGRWFGRRLSR
jgi:hypothetical protein